MVLYALPYNQSRFWIYSTFYHKFLSVQTRWERKSWLNQRRRECCFDYTASSFLNAVNRINQFLSLSLFIFLYKMQSTSILHPQTFFSVCKTLAWSIISEIFDYAAYNTLKVEAKLCICGLFRPCIMFSFSLFIVWYFQCKQSAFVIFTEFLTICRCR